MTYIVLSFATAPSLREEGVLTSRRVGAWMEAPMGSLVWLLSHAKAQLVPSEFQGIETR